MSQGRFGIGISSSPDSKNYYLTKKISVSPVETDEESAHACLESVLRYFDVPIPKETIRAKLSHRAKPSFVDLANIIEGQGLITHSFGLRRVSQISKIELPAITVFGHRFVVAYKWIKGKGLMIYDPIDGPRLILPQLLKKIWSGQVLTIRAELDFFKATQKGEKKETKKEGEEPKSSEFEKGLLSRLRYLKLFKNSGAFFFNVSLLTLILFGLGIIGPRLNQLIMDEVLVHNDVNLLQVVVMGLVLVNITTLVFTGFRSYVSTYVAQFLDFRISTLFYRQALGLKISDHNKNRVGTMTSYFGELGNLRSILTGEAVNVGFQLLSSIVFTAWLFTYTWKVAVLPLAIAPIVFIISKFYGGFFRRLYRETFEKASETSSILSEQLEGVATVKSIGAEKQAATLWERAFVDRIQLQKKTANSSILYQFFLGFMQEAVKIGGFYLTVRLALGEELSAGAVIAVSQYLVQALGPIISLSAYLDEYQQASITFEKLDEVFSKAVVKQNKGYALQEPELEGEIEFKNVNFKYKEGSPLVLKNINLKIPKNKVTAIVGQSGSGKTTLAKLIPRLIEPTEGDINFDGIEAKSISLSAIRKQTGMVLQDSHLMAGSILDNITFADDNPDPERVKWASELSGSLDFIKELPTKFETYISEGGMGLSGGQKQRVSIARTLYRDPKILIFDEATSSLDAETEAKIQANMREIVKGRTSIIIAHRLNTIQNADQIVVIEAGEIVEIGTHQALVEKGGAYAKLFAKQMN